MKSGIQALLLILFAGFFVLGIPQINASPSPSAWPFANDGVENPSSYYQRYRLDSYPDDRPFYQWWYYCVKDLSGTGRSFAMSYGFTKCVSNHTREGFYMMFSEVSKDGAFEKYEKYDLDEMKVSNEFDIDVIDSSGGNPYFLHVLDDDNFHLQGSMNNPERLWYSHGENASQAISWDFTVTRINGWFGQQDLETAAELKGIIDWNTYSFNSLVKGSITVGGTQYLLDHSQRFRAYGDMNWGDYFPTGPTIEYCWGWYTVVLPSEDSSRDISLVAGVGVSDTGFLLHTMSGSFADIQLSSGEHIGFRKVTADDNTPHPVNLLLTASDGEFIRFDVNRTEWATYEDDLGTAKVPLVQTVTIESSKLLVLLTFDSKKELYNRLLFPHEEYVFSDFEALNVPTRVKIIRKPSEVIIDTTISNGGLEFGYRVPIKPIL